VHTRAGQYQKIKGKCVRIKKKCHPEQQKEIQKCWATTATTTDYGVCSKVLVVRKFELNNFYLSILENNFDRYLTAN
jgi:hypothetical protein